MANIKLKRREQLKVADDYPGPSAQGNAASDQNRFWFVRAQSWSEGAGVNTYLDVELENERQLARAQVPWRDKNPGAQANGIDTKPPVVGQDYAEKQGAEPGQYSDEGGYERYLASEHGRYHPDPLSSASRPVSDLEKAYKIPKAFRGDWKKYDK